MLSAKHQGKSLNKGGGTYKFTKIEVLDEETPNTPNGVGSHPQPKVGSSYPLTNLLQKVEKAHDLGNNLLVQSKKADESTDLYRNPDEKDDVWTDKSLGLE